MKVVITGSKEYPFGSGNADDDPSPSGGIELYVDKLVAALLQTGMEVTVITRQFRGQADEKTGKLTVVRVPFRKGFYLRNPTFNLNTFRRLLGMDFDVLIAHGEIAQFFGLLAAKLKRKPVVMVCHGTATDQPHYPRVVRWVFGVLERLTYGLSDANITHSPQHLNHITTRFDVILPGMDERRAAAVGNAERESLKKELGIGKEKVIVYTGRLIASKGVDYLIRGLHGVREPTVCIIVGEGKERGRLERLARDEQVNVRFTGFRKDVNRFLSLADVFVLPSLSESLNYSMLEAATAGVPIVVTDLGIIPPGAAFIVGKRDSAAIAGAITTVLSQPKLAAQKVAQAKLFAGKFDWDEAAHHYRSVLKRVCRKEGL